ncbi:MAG TPA: patatin-like phospholipase family protein [Anaerolineales bacterium]|nr:patatin-like phospholipase family protein [Anaerolineales bacterium]
MDIALALGGGGSKGNAHIGVIRRLEQQGFHIKAIAGTSFGGLVAVFYALGYSPDEIEEMFASRDQSQLYGHISKDTSSLLGLAGTTAFLEEVIGDRTFEDLILPCILTATDLNSGKEVFLSKGSLIEAILSAIAIPGVFPARRVDGFELVDGGTLDPVPVVAARSLAPKLPVLAVVLTIQMGNPAQAWNIPLPEYLPLRFIARVGKMRYGQALDVFMRSFDIVTRAVTEYRLEMDKPDAIIRPHVTSIDTLDRVNVHEVVQMGEAAVDEALPELKKIFIWRKRLRRRIGL